MTGYNASIVRFMSKEGVELFHFDEDKTGCRTYDTVYIKDNNSIAVSSGNGKNRCITIIDKIIVYLARQFCLI
jgi:hypothetical protein